MTRPSKSEWLAIILVFAIAAFTRLWHYDELRFSHDEISALQRTGYENFAELIEKGVATDGHPAFTQVYLYYFRQFFGLNEMGLKSFFTFLSFASLIWILLIGYRLRKPWAGIYTAALFACSQSFLMYAHLARPYGPGLFFSLGSLYFWLSYFRKSKSGWHLAGFVVFSALSAYSHHFAALFCGLLYLSGLRRGSRLYRLSAFAILTLYAPHLPLFFEQLSLGGIGSWLAPPKANFLPNYFGFIFNYSWLWGALFLFPVLLGLKLKPKDWRFPEGLLIFLAGLSIAYAYSLLIDPVLQFSVMVFFAAPLFLSLLVNVKFRKPLSLLVIFSAAGLFSLYYHRQYYPLMYESRFSFTKEMLEQDENAYLLSFLDSAKYDFQRALEPQADHPWRYCNTLLDYQAALDEVPKKKTLFIAGNSGLPHEAVHLAIQAGWRLDSIWHRFNLSLYRFIPQGHKPLKATKYWTSRGDQYQLTETIKYSQAVEDSLKNIALPGAVYYLQNWEITANKAGVVDLAAAVYQGDRLIYWSSRTYRLKAGFQVIPQAMVLPKFKEDFILKRFAVNTDRLNFSLKATRWAAYRDNPRWFGRFYSFPRADL